jgi:hypothetical protein
MPIAKERKLTRSERLRAVRAASEGREYHVPVRQLMQTSPLKIRRELFSFKMHTYIPCESLIEHDHYSICDVRTDVISIRVQPEIIEYHLGGKKRWTVPDARVEFADGRVELHECRTDKEAALEQTKAEVSAIKEACEELGLDYIEFPESEIRREPRLSNALLLRDERMHHVSESVESTVRHLLQGKASVSLREVCLESLSVRVVQRDVVAMALYGRVVIDWEHNPIGPETRVSLPP